jgi:DNA-binding CsgD family transcriptional regulator
VAAPASEQADVQLIGRAVHDLAQRTRFPIVFGGLAREGAIHVSAISGSRTHSIDGLVVRAGRGLGGRAFVEGRPRLALDYRMARGITHDYDRAILGEGIATLFAVPIVAAGRSRGVLYCGARSASPIGDAVAAPALRVAEEVATELRVRDEVNRRLHAMSSIAPSPIDPSPVLSTAARDELRVSFAELRSISSGVDDPDLRDRLAAVERRLASLAQDDTASAGTPDVRLSPREVDVLAGAALGWTNAEVAASLSLKEATVKSYLQSAMAKLDASTRHAAVLAARRAGLLP